MQKPRPAVDAPARPQILTSEHDAHLSEHLARRAEEALRGERKVSARARARARARIRDGGGCPSRFPSNRSGLVRVG